jgi:hypothetical protein
VPNTEEWGKGYDFGQIGMMKAIKTAEELGAANERSRIIELLRTLRKQAQERNLSQTANINAVIALIKGEHK